MGQDSSFGPTVILVSLDGFRTEYLSRGFTPVLTSLASKGISAKYMRPVFPSLTFPNHYTIVTGLYPESHGIVANIFHDPKLNDTFVYIDSVKNAESKWWGGEPLWVTARKQGLISATMMWPGSEAAIQNVRPNYYVKYNGSMSLEERIDGVLGWLDLRKSRRPNFITLYASDVDSKGHTDGPYSKAVNTSLSLVDSMIGRLISGLESRGIQDAVDLIIVSDHGTKLIFLKNVYNLNRKPYRYDRWC
jgi:predicted AlkP superfamily pyrophosphatase or phosphodiesterase